LTGGQPGLNQRLFRPSLDNDDGAKEIVKLLGSSKFQDLIELMPPQLDRKNDLRKAEFIRVLKNLYVVFTPLAGGGEGTDIEYFFDRKTRLLKHPSGKCFNTVEARDSKADLSKEVFASQIIKERKKHVDFKGLKPLLDSIVKVIEHYNKVK
ncbi:MAG: hypothetical protein V7757_17495, partial [Halopseudomonas aestusnigri]